MRFSLVVPALNEEEAIASTLRRALAARARVLAETPVTAMTVVFVNDGSTDGTQTIVDQPEFAEVVKVRFEKNRGYGAAIKAGWRAADAGLLGFMDADGTCDPEFCVPLIQRLLETDADIVLAARLGPDTKMPLIRQLGNRLFAGLLGAVSGQDLTDSASGFRILRRDSLRLLTPLPDGLHFTPAMSSIGLLDPRVRIEEVPMPYEERTGKSKLSVLKDGLRFLFIILFTTAVYNPIRSFLVAALAVALGFAGLAGLALVAGAGDAAMVIALVGTAAVLLLVGAGVTVHQLNFLLLGPIRRDNPLERALQRLLRYKGLLAAGLGLSLVALVGLAAAVAFAGAALGAVVWLLGLLFVGLLLMVGGVLMRVIWVVGQRQAALTADVGRGRNSDKDD
jgi:glycosyltransferase involved in cell wall biosynthesis